MTPERFSALLQFADQWGSLTHSLSFELLDAYAQKTHEIVALRQTHAAEIITLKLMVTKLEEKCIDLYHQTPAGILEASQ